MPRFFPIVLLACAVASFAQSPSPLRLPADPRPLTYQATLDITPGADSFQGALTISLAFTKPQADVILHAKEIQIAHVTPAPESIKTGENDLVTLHYAQPFPAGTAELKIEYTGQLSRILTDGAFQQKHSGEWYVFTKFEPITARRVFPCFDEPGFKVPWQLSLRVPQELKAFSNTSIAQEEPQPNGKKLVQFRRTKPLPSYLVAFAVGPFDVVETAPVGKNRVPSRIAVPKGRAAEAEYAASITPKLIEMLEGYFGTPYPYDKLDQVVVPLTTAWGAMENAGMIAYGDFLLAPKTQDSEQRHQSTALTMEHEMSHQWFGDLVTMQWWNDIWLNEAFASWISNKLVAQWHPEWRVEEGRAASSRIFRADSLTSARKVRQPIESAGDIGTAFDGITYGKGLAVIAMFEHYTGELKFRTGVRNYLQAHAFGNATSDDLLAALDRVAPGLGVGKAFRSFLDQIGFPLVTVALDCSQKAALQLRQERLVPKGSAAQKTSLWNVPVCVSWNGGSQCVLLKTAAQSFALKSKSCPGWLFADSGAAGYYASISAPPETARLSRMEKAAYLRNLRVLFSSGVGDLLQELKTASPFSRDDDPNLVAESASLLSSIGSLTDPDSRASYAARLQELYGNRARQLGWRPKASDTPEIRALRSELVPLVAREGEDSALAQEAQRLADEWLKDRNSLEAEMVPEVLYTAAWTRGNGTGGNELFARMADAVRTTKIQRERSWIIAGLAGFRDTSLAHSALGLIGAPGIDARETSRLLFNGNDSTRDVIWQYVKANFDKLNASLPGARGVPFGATLPNAAAGFCTDAAAAEVSNFFAPKLANMPGGPRNLGNAVERIHLCAAQAEIAKPAVASFLRP